MRRLLIAAALSALVWAKPELYKETEDFQFSRSSSDEGSKSGFYGAQRGNMGGNYEKAHNMDGLAQHQMSGLVRQIDGELGDGYKTRTGSVFTAANSRGIYGSGNYDLSNLQGRNFEETESFGDASLHSSSMSQSAGFRDRSLLDSGAYSNRRAHTSGYRQYQTGGLSADQLQLEDNLQSADRLHSAHGYDYGSQAAQFSNSGFQSHRAYDQSNVNSRYSSAYGSNTRNHMLTAAPVRVVVRPGTRVTVPLTAEAYDASHATSSLDNRRVNTDAELLSTSGQESNIGTVNAPKHYESSYSYRKKWEKHDTQPIAVDAIPTVNPFASQSELLEGNQAMDLESSQHRSANSFNSQASNAAYAANTKSVASSQSRYQTGFNTQHSSGSGISSNGYNTASHASDARGATINTDSANLVELLNTKPKSYHSSYSYHKAWERQGDPYVIQPVGGPQIGQTSQKLTAASLNQGAYSSHHYGSQYKQAHQSFSHNGVDCDEEGHVRLARSYDPRSIHQEQQFQTYQNQEEFGQQSQLENLEDLGQHVQGEWDNLQDLGQQTQEQWGNLEQQNQHPWDNLQNLGKRTQENFDKLQDLGQQTETKLDQLEDFGQQSQWDNTQGLGQQMQGKQDNFQDLGQQIQEKFDKLEDLGQQTETKLDQLEDFGQQSQWGNTQGLGQQMQGKQNNFQDLGQQTQGKFDKLEDLGQQLEDLGQQSQSQWDNLQTLGQVSQNQKNNLDLGQQSDSYWNTIQQKIQQSQSILEQQLQSAIFGQEFKEPKEQTSVNFHQQSLDSWKSHSHFSEREKNEQNDLHNFQNQDLNFHINNQNKISNNEASEQNSFFTQLSDTSNTSNDFKNEQSYYQHSFHEQTDENQYGNIPPSLSGLWDKIDNIAKNSLAGDNDDNITHTPINEESPSRTQNQDTNRTYTYLPNNTRLYGKVLTTNKSDITPHSSNEQPSDIGRGDIGPEDTHSTSDTSDISQINESYKTPQEIEALSLTQKLDETSSNKDVENQSTYSVWLNLDDEKFIEELRRQIKKDKEKQILKSTTSTTAKPSNYFSHSRATISNQLNHKQEDIETSSNEQQHMEQQFEDLDQQIQELQNSHMEDFGQQMQSSWHPHEYLKQDKYNQNVPLNQFLQKPASPNNFNLNNPSENPETNKLSQEAVKNTNMEITTPQEMEALSFTQKLEETSSNKDVENQSINSVWLNLDDEKFIEELRHQIKVDEEKQILKSTTSTTPKPSNYFSHSSATISNQLNHKQEDIETSSNEQQHMEQQFEDLDQQIQELQNSHMEDFGQQMQSSWHPEEHLKQAKYNQNVPLEKFPQEHVLPNYSNLNNPSENLENNNQNVPHNQFLQEPASPNNFNLNNPSENSETNKLSQEVVKNTNMESTIPESEEPGFWKKIGKKLADTKNKVYSWFKSK